MCIRKICSATGEKICSENLYREITFLALWWMALLRPKYLSEHITISGYFSLNPFKVSMFPLFPMMSFKKHTPALYNENSPCTEVKKMFTFSERHNYFSIFCEVLWSVLFVLEKPFSQLLYFSIQPMDTRGLWPLLCTPPPSCIWFNTPARCRLNNVRIIRNQQHMPPVKCGSLAGYTRLRRMPCLYNRSCAGVFRRLLWERTCVSG